MHKDLEKFLEMTNVQKSSQSQINMCAPYVAEECGKYLCLDSNDISDDFSLSSESNSWIVIPQTKSSCAIGWTQFSIAGCAPIEQIHLPTKLVSTTPVE